MDGSSVSEESKNRPSGHFANGINASSKLCEKLGGSKISRCENGLPIFALISISGKWENFQFTFFFII